jgi:hypothetical protein
VRVVVVPDRHFLRRLPITENLSAADINEKADAAENIDPKLAAEPIESPEAAEPIDPIERIDPTDPIESTEPFEPMERIDSSDHSDHFECLLMATNVGSRAVDAPVDATVDASVARKTWRTLEPVHGMIYFAPEAAAAYAAAGLDDARAGYFASRAAPMGAVPAEVVVATFFNFNPTLVGRAVPRCWSLVAPEVMLAARLDAADMALRRILGSSVAEGSEVAEAAALARTAATAPTMSVVGRPLYAGHASLPWPDAPHLVLWHAISRLREYRGDGHIAALVGAGLGAVDALVIHAGTGEVPRAALQQSRAWDDASWEAGVARMHARGWVDPDGSLTASGREHRAGVEDLTDRLALAPWEHLGAEGCARLRSLVRPLSQAVVAANTFTVMPTT